MEGTTETYYSYGNIYTSTAEVFYPKTIKELQQIIAFCQQAGRKITPVGSFHSFDRQNASKDVAVSMRHFDQVNCDPQKGIVVVGAGASWGKIFDEVYEKKCLIYTCITGSAPTAGGTLSINSCSVWTPGVGKEADYCISFEFVTTEGEVLTCSRTENEELFRGVIGGLGLLGFITSITYRVLPVGSDFEITFEVDEYDDIDDIEKRLDLRKAKHLDTLESIQGQATLFYREKGIPKFNVYNRRYQRIPRANVASKFSQWSATLASGLIRYFPKLADQAVLQEKGKPPHKRLLIKHLSAPRYGLFWAQPDYEWSKTFSRFFQKLGYEPKLYQNSYFIPIGEDKVSTFTKKVYELNDQYQLRSFMFDVLHIPQDDLPFVLSCSRDTAGFYVNTTFMDSTNKEHLMTCYTQLNQLALEMGGALNLSKNCFIEPAILEQMYAPALEEFVQLKKKYDPSNLLTSDFFEYYFPSYFGKNA